MAYSGSKKDFPMMAKTGVRAALLLALCVAPTIGYTDGMPVSDVASGVAATNIPRLAAKTDDRGFINVWQLRHDVALIEPLAVADQGEGACESRQEYEGGEDAADPSTLSKRREVGAASIRRQMEAAAAKERECVTQARAAHQSYIDAFHAFNASWLPVLTEAMRRSDPVAEVILRQCSTTPVIDRSNIESTCAADPAEKRKAVARLKEIGFAPAFELTEEPGYWESGPGRSYSTKGRLALQEIILSAIAAGNLGNIPSAATGCILEEYDFRHNSRLIQEARFRVQQAFTFSWSDNQTDSLKLVRHPIRATELTWGPATLTTLPDRIFLNSIVARTPQSASGGGYTPDVMRRIDPCLGLGLHLSDTYHDVHDLVHEENASIEHYLNLDPRWGVFLMKRIGHHEWLPNDMEPEPTKLGNEWMGHWVLSKTYEDFSTASENHKGGADIYLDGATPHITIKTDVPEHSWPSDITRCTLHGSGTLTPPGKNGSTVATVLGDLDKIVEWRGDRVLIRSDNWVNKKTGLVNGLEPFEEGKRYQQILLLCEGGEEAGSEAVRFLLLSNDTLIEVSRPLLHSGAVYIRHFRRPMAFSVLGVVSENTASFWEFLNSTWVSITVAAQDILQQPWVRFTFGIVLLVGLMWGFVIVMIKMRRG